MSKDFKYAKAYLLMAKLMRPRSDLSLEIAESSSLVTATVTLGKHLLGMVGIPADPV